MLVLTRRIGDKILIGDDIEITVTGVKGFKVWLGVDAPKKVRILKAELLDSYGLERKSLSTNSEVGRQTQKFWYPINFIRRLIRCCWK